VTTREVVVHHDASLLAAAVAARLITRVVDAQSAQGSASVVLTAGGIGVAVLAAIASSPARDAIDWRRIDLWWGDERYLPSGHAERNETQARDALLDRLEDLAPAHVHPMPADDGSTTVEDAADAYARVLAAAARPEDHGPVPRFDVVLLGIGPDGHVASLFPGQPGVYDERPVLAVRGAPKPPPQRISLGFSALCSGREVWVVAAGAEKAGVVSLALSGAGRVQLPAAGVTGQARTLFLLDRAAAGQLAGRLGRIASP
jgi:6-phosphogluconolactonase